MIRFILRITVQLTLILFFCVYFIRATNQINYKVEAIESFKTKNAGKIRIADNTVKLIQNKVRDFDFQDFKKNMINLYLSFKIDVENEVEKVKENNISIEKDLVVLNKAFGEHENQNNENPDNNQGYKKELDSLTRLIKKNKKAVRMNIQHINQKKIRKINRKLGRVNDPSRREELISELKILQGDNLN